MLEKVRFFYNIQHERHGHILQEIAKLVDGHHLRPLIDPLQFSLDSVSKAHKLMESGKAVGKIVIQL